MLRVPDVESVGSVGISVYLPEELDSFIRLDDPPYVMLQGEPSGTYIVVDLGMEFSIVSNLLTREQFSVRTREMVMLDRDEVDENGFFRWV